MIIDMHVHLFPTREVGLKVINAIKNVSGHGSYSTGTPEEYIEDMNKAGIDYGVIVSFAPDNQLKNNNFWTTAITRPQKSGTAKYPMLIPYVSVSPTMKGKTPIEELEHKLSWGMRGLKIHPIAQKFAPDDRRMWPVYQWLLDHDLPLTAHSGINIIPDQDTDLARPSRWRAVLQDYPTLKLTLAHMGGGFWDEAIQICRDYPQVMLDTAIAISHIDPRGKPNMLTDAQAVEMIRTVGANRVMFGSDYPWINPSLDIQRLQRLPLNADEKRLILGENAARLLNL